MENCLELFENQVAILVVDDEPSIQKLVSRIMGSAGYQTDAASNGEEALGYIKKKNYDIVITDIGMPKMDGIELTKKILTAFPVEIIIMTGRIEEYSYDKIINLGASDFVQKPFTPAEILLRTNRVLKERWLKDDHLRNQREFGYAQKLESIGQIAAGIAHEINTPIQYIGNNTIFIKESFQELNEVLQTFLNLFEALKNGPVDPSINEQIQRKLEKTDLEYLCQEIPAAIGHNMEGIERVSNIVKSMKVFLHPGNKEHVPADLNQCIQNTINLVKNEWKDIANISIDFDKDLPMFTCNPGEMNQVFLNIIVNACHSISDKQSHHPNQRGKIEITTRNKGNRIEIEISDTGTGIPERAKAQIFDPFFTTKKVGMGTGQGLAISRSVVVDRHKGNIDFKTVKEVGTSFIISLPVNKAQCHK